MGVTFIPVLSRLLGIAGLLLALFLSGCIDPVDELKRKYGFPDFDERWYLNGQLYLISFYSGGATAVAYRIVKDASGQEQFTRVPNPLKDDLFQARQRTLNARVYPLSTSDHRSSGSTAVADSTPLRLAYFQNADQHFVKFDTSTQPPYPYVQITCADKLGNERTNYFDITPDGLVAVVSANAINDNVPCLAFVDTANLKIMHRLPLPMGYTVAGIAISRDGKTAYASLIARTIGPPQLVAVIDIASAQLTTTIPIDVVASLNFLVSAPDGTTIYAGGGSSNLYAIDTLTNTVAATVPVRESLRALAVHPDGSRVYLEFDSGAIAVVDAQSYATIHTIPAPAGCCPQFGSEPVFTPDGIFLIILNSPTAASVIETTADTIVGSIPLPPNPNGLPANSWNTLFFLPDS